MPQKKISAAQKAANTYKNYEKSHRKAYEQAMSLVQRIKDVDPCNLTLIDDAVQEYVAHMKAMREIEVARQSAYQEWLAHRPFCTRTLIA